jgi:MFS transporter, ACS family, hexuronate transporter
MIRPFELSVRRRRRAPHCQHTSPLPRLRVGLTIAARIDEPRHYTDFMHAERSRIWVWWIVGILFFASMINYMDRLTLSNNIGPISKELGLNNEDYGWLEFAFGVAFAVGAILFGAVADRVSIRWFYPCILLLWSAMGFAGSFAQSFRDLLLCRLLLGFFEAGHWPSALKTTQRLLPPENRALGNSILQSGLAFGAILTPQLISFMDPEEIGVWRPVFQVVGALGIVWVVLWLASVGPGDVDADPAEPKKIDKGPGFFVLARSRKYVALILIVVVINICWHTCRVWLPKFLVDGRGYSRRSMLNFMTVFNIVSDIGCLTVGFATMLLARRGMAVHGSRVLVFSICAFLALVGVAIPWLEAGPFLMATMLAVGFGAAGMFPCYYAFSQELTRTHQGKVTGTLGAFAWGIPACWHIGVGIWADATGSFDLGMVIAFILPLIGVAAILFVWPGERRSEFPTPTEVPSDAVVSAERVSGIH